MIEGMLAVLAAQVSPTPALASPLEPMSFLVGHCWQGEFTGGAVDIHCFEPVHGGRFIRDRHEVTGGRGTYAGETLYHWNARAGRIEYSYWASSGGVSRGSVTPRQNVLDFGDEVHRGADGRELRIATAWHRLGDEACEVRAISTADPSGRVVRYRRLDSAPVRIAESTAPDGTRSLSHELVVAAPIEQVYAALATAEGWRGWAVPHAWASAEDPGLMETSYAPAGHAGDPRNIQQRLVLKVPNRVVAFRTVRAPPGFPHAEIFSRVTNLFELQPAGIGTRVRLTGIGYPAGAAGTNLIGFFREGNRTTLEQLRGRFATGPVNWAERRPAAQH